jgi:N6-adenosine-specific RNA methylase IME4
MRHTDLPSPGALMKGMALRVDVAQSISFIESRARRTATVPDQLVTLRAFLAAAQAKLDAIEAEYFPE